MARPRKQNADYFPHDAGMRNDDKIKAIRRKYKHEGYAVWNMLLEKLCGSVNFTCEYNDESIELMAGDFDVDSDKLTEMVLYFEKIKLIRIQDGHLFSKTMITQFEALFRKRKRDRDALSLTETQFKDNFGSDSA